MAAEVVNTATRDTSSIVASEGASAGDAQAVAQSLVEQALVPLGAKAVAVWAVSADAALTLAGFAGFSVEEAGRWRHVPPGVATPARRALADRQTIWLDDLAQSGLPSIGRTEVPGGRVSAPAIADGRVCGVLEIGWSDPLAPQSAAVRRQIDSFAELCAHTLQESHAGRLSEDLVRLTGLADGILDSCLVLAPVLDQDGHVADFRIHHVNKDFADPAGRPRGAITGALFLEAYPMAAQDGGMFGMIERVHATGEPFCADNVALTTLVGEVPMAMTADVSVSRQGDGVLLIWRLRDETTQLASLLQHAQRLGRIGAFDENILTGEVIWNSQLFELYGTGRHRVTSTPRSAWCTSTS
jgi:hypothetical protein